MKREALRKLNLEAILALHGTFVLATILACLMGAQGRTMEGMEPWLLIALVPLAVSMPLMVLDAWLQR